MISHIELSARAALCRQLASREPDSKNVWLAEAERWSHFTQGPGDTAATPHDARATAWCWYVTRKRKPLADEMTAMRIYSRSAE
jgi:hypothetical protein